MKLVAHQPSKARLERCRRWLDKAMILVMVIANGRHGRYEWTRTTGAAMSVTVRLGRCINIQRGRFTGTGCIGALRVCLVPMVVLLLLHLSHHLREGCGIGVVVGGSCIVSSTPTFRCNRTGSLIGCVCEVTTSIASW